MERTIVAELDVLEDWVPEEMKPGMMFLLEQPDGTNDARNPYLAVLACPQCGSLGLITRRQYAGAEAMICGADNCSAEYFLGEDTIRFRLSH